MINLYHKITIYKDIYKPTEYKVPCTKIRFLSRDTGLKQLQISVMNTLIQHNNK